MRDTKNAQRAARTIVFSAVIALSVLVNAGHADAASVDTRDGATVAHGMFTRPSLPAFLIRIVLPFGISWED